MFLLKKLLTSLILPPAGPVLLALAGLWLSSGRRRQAGVLLAAGSLCALLALSLPIVGGALLRQLEIHPPATEAGLARAQAIVILGGGNNFAAPEYGGDTVNSSTLQRIRYGARLHRQVRLPILVSGGAPFGGLPEGHTMKEALEKDFGVSVRWIEATSHDTSENARNSAPLLKAAGVRRIALVSHAWHLPRAIELFEREGIEVIPAPTAYTTEESSVLAQFLPSPGGLGNSRLALHERLGRLAAGL